MAKDARLNSAAASHASQQPGDPGPQFLCIGPANSATTWLADQLKLYPDIWLPPIQELNYFSSGFNRFKGTADLELRWGWWDMVKRLVRNKSFSPRRDFEFLAAARALADQPDSKPDLNAYARLFEAARGKITGDISPMYGTLTTEQIGALAPMLEGRRIFMIARDPIQRFWSAMSMYWRLQTYGEQDYGSLEIAQRLFTDPLRSRHHFPSRILARWNEGLKPERLDVFYFDEIAEHPGKALSAIVAYVGGNPSRRIGLVHPGFNRKRNLPKPSISPAARDWVRDAFQDELRACARVFGAFGHRWLDRHGC